MRRTDHIRHLSENDDADKCGDDSLHRSSRQNSNGRTADAQTSAYENDQDQLQHLVDNGLEVSGSLREQT